MGEVPNPCLYICIIKNCWSKPSAREAHFSMWLQRHILASPGLWPHFQAYRMGVAGHSQTVENFQPRIRLNHLSSPIEACGSQRMHSVWSTLNVFLPHSKHHPKRYSIYFCKELRLDGNMQNSLLIKKKKKKKHLFKSEILTHSLTHYPQINRQQCFSEFHLCRTLNFS